MLSFFQKEFLPFLPDGPRDCQERSSSTYRSSSFIYLSIYFLHIPPAEPGTEIHSVANHFNFTFAVSLWRGFNRTIMPCLIEGGEKNKSSVIVDPCWDLVLAASPVISFLFKKMTVADWSLLLSIISSCFTWNTLYVKALCSGHLSVWCLRAQTSFSNLFQ